MGHIPPLWTRHSIFGSDPLFSSLVPFCIQVGTRWLIAVRANGRISTERYRRSHEDPDSPVAYQAAVVFLLNA